MKWMRNSTNETKRMRLETAHLKGKVDCVAMDSKADDLQLFREFRRYQL